MVLRIVAITWVTGAGADGGAVLVERDIPNTVQSVLDCPMTPNLGRDLQRSGRHHRHRLNIKSVVWVIRLKDYTVRGRFGTASAMTFSLSVEETGPERSYPVDESTDFDQRPTTVNRRPNS